MSCFWMGLSLLIVLQHSVSSDEYVKLNCSETAEFSAGRSGILNCTIRCIVDKCNAIGFNWSDADGTNLCNLPNYSCDWDEKTYVSLKILNVSRNQTVTVYVDFVEDMDHSEIQVKVCADETGAIMKSKSPDEQKRTTIVPVFVAAIAVAIVAILCFMLKTYSKQHIGPTNVTDTQPFIHAP